MSRGPKFERVTFLLCATSLLVLIVASHIRNVAAGARPSREAASAGMLTGTALGPDGKPLAGVTISARETQKTFTTTVFTDERGTYSFPPLDDGQYKVWAQAVGFEAGHGEVHLESGKGAIQNFKLKATDDFTTQLSGSEMVEALPSDTPEDRRMKEIFAHNCVACHTPSFVLQNRFDEKGWQAILTAMQRAQSTGNWLTRPLPIIRHFDQDLVAYLAKVSGPGPSPMKFHPLPRPTGEAARVVITEFDIPPADTPSQLAVENGSEWANGTPSAYRNRGTHDVAIDFDGNAWISSSEPNHDRSYGKIDRKTGTVTNFKIPGKNGWVRTSHGISTGPDGMIWITINADGDSNGMLGRITPQTGKIDLFMPPAGMTPVTPVGGHVDIDGKGKVWIVTLKGGLRFDPVTSQFTDFISPSVNDPKFSTYGLAADSQGNGWWAILTLDRLGVSDISTGKAREVQYAARPEMQEVVTEEDKKFYEGPENMPPPLSNNTSAPWVRTPRRLAGDHTGNYMWSADFLSQDIASVDIRTLKVTYYQVPIPYSNVYDVEVDKNHIVWASLRNADRVGRLDPTTKKWTVFSLPTLGVEARNIAVDQKSGDIWLASFRASKAIRLHFPAER